MASSSSSDAPTATVVATPDPEAVAESERIKLLANKEFVSKNYVAAIELYSQAIDKNPANAILFANRSACHLAIENYGTAIADATTAIELDPTYQKVRDWRVCTMALSCARRAHTDHVGLLSPRRGSRCHGQVQAGTR